MEDVVHAGRGGVYVEPLARDHVVCVGDYPCRQVLSAFKDALVSHPAEFLERSGAEGRPAGVQAVIEADIGKDGCVPAVSLRDQSIQFTYGGVGIGKAIDAAVHGDAFL